MHAVREFEGQLVLLELLENRRILTAGYSAVMHIHTAVEEVVITDLIAEQDRKTGEPEEAPALREEQQHRDRPLHPLASRVHGDLRHHATARTLLAA